MALAVERDARAEVARRVVPRLRLEDLLRVDELVALELGSARSCHAISAVVPASARCCVPLRGFA